MNTIPYDPAFADPERIRQEEQELKRLDSIENSKKKQQKESESLLSKNATYTESKNKIAVLNALGFLEGDTELKAIVPDPNNTDRFLKSCIYKSNNTVAFHTDNNDSANISPIVSVSNMDTFYYYINKIFVFKEGREIEMHMQYMESTDEVSDKHQETWMISSYDNFYVLKINNKLYTIDSLVETFDIEECNEPERG